MTDNLKAREGLVLPLMWEELTQPREDGPAEPTGDWEGRGVVGFYHLYIFEDHYEATGPEDEDIEGDFGDAETAKAACQADYASRLLPAVQPLLDRLAEVERERHETLTLAKDEGADFVLAALGKALGYEYWTQHDGSETWDGDVHATLMHLLWDAEVLDRETNERLSPPIPASELFGELTGALRTAISIIGHPDDAVTKAMAEIVSRAEASIKPVTTVAARTLSHTMESKE